MNRTLIVTADDFGIGPETSRGILELARRGAVTTSVLLVNSPYAEEAVDAWRRADVALELGWHPCLTLDRPVLPASAVPTLVDAEGRFPSLATLLGRLALGRVNERELAAELAAQRQRFIDLVGRPPTVINGHHHVHVLPRVGSVLERLLASQRPRPYLRRVREPWRLFATTPRSRAKRMFLNLLGRRVARRQDAHGFPGNDWLLGLGRLVTFHDAERFRRCLADVPAGVVELVCHPGFYDVTLLGRDATRSAELTRRKAEWEYLCESGFRDDCHRAGFTISAPARLAGGMHAA